MLRGHSETIGERLLRDLDALMVLPPTPYDACEKVSTRATSISMVRYRGNDYSVPVAYAHHEVQVRGYVGKVVIGAGTDIIARHRRSYEKADMVFDPLHFLPLLERKVGALDQAAPLQGWELPQAFATLRRLLEARMGKPGKREYVQALRLLETFEMDHVHGAVRQAKEFEFSQGVQSGRTYWKWFHLWKSQGDEGLFDSYRNCGGHSRYSDEVEAYVRQTVTSIAGSVGAAIEAENKRRISQAVPEAGLPVVGYDYVHKVIVERAPLDHAIRRKGWDIAYKDLHSLGLGIQTSRALERVEIDEYTVDLMVLMRDTGLFDHLPASVRQFIGLDGEACRVTLSAAIDVHTRCLLALQIVPPGHESPLRDTVEMIYMNKAPISDAARCRFTWHQSGAPEMIVLDRGPDYISDEAYAVLASLGITNMGAPAAKPWLKPFIERVFRTIHEDLLQRFSGRTFSNVVQRGENDPAKRATLTLEAFGSSEEPRQRAMIC